jgi:hypothetical protein
VGIEDKADLINELEHALSVVQTAVASWTITFNWLSINGIHR